MKSEALKKTKVLFVCMGNICRSPTAEIVVRHFIKFNNLGGVIEVDSAGTHGYHVGEAPDGRTQRAASVRGYNLSQMRARKVARQDLDYFDLILAMDQDNLAELGQLKPADAAAELRLFAAIAVPDPYQGGPDDFERVLDVVESGCEVLIAELNGRLGTS